MGDAFFSAIANALGGFGQGRLQQREQQEAAQQQEFQNQLAQQQIDQRAEQIEIERQRLAQQGEQFAATEKRLTTGQEADILQSREALQLQRDQFGFTRESFGQEFGLKEEQLDWRKLIEGGQFEDQHALSLQSIRINGQRGDREEEAHDVLMEYNRLQLANQGLQQLSAEFDLYLKRETIPDRIEAAGLANKVAAVELRTREQAADLFDLVGAPQAYADLLLTQSRSAGNAAQTANILTTTSTIIPRLNAFLEESGIKTEAQRFALEQARGLRGGDLSGLSNLDLNDRIGAGIKGLVSIDEITGQALIDPIAVPLISTELDELWRRWKIDGDEAAGARWRSWKSALGDAVQPPVEEDTDQNGKKRVPSSSQDPVERGGVVGLILGTSERLGFRRSAAETEKFNEILGALQSRAVALGLNPTTELISELEIMARSVLKNPQTSISDDALRRIFEQPITAVEGP